MEEAYDCVVHRVKTSCNSLTHRHLTVDELQWFISKHAGKLASGLEPRNASHILDFILSEGLPVAEETYNDYINYYNDYDSIEGKVPYYKFQGLHDILYLFRSHAITGSVERPLSLAVQTVDGNYGVIFWDRTTDNWMFTAQRNHARLTADYIMCEAEPVKIHPELFFISSSM